MSESTRAEVLARYLPPEPDWLVTKSKAWRWMEAIRHAREVDHARALATGDPDWPAEVPA